MTKIELENKLYEFIKPVYPEIKIEVVDKSDNSRQLYFTDEKFKSLYPKQRYHSLHHLIPSEFYKQHLENIVWFELVPGENHNDLDYHDQETIDEIKDNILTILKDKVHFMTILDNEFALGHVKCFGDFRHSKKILTDLNFPEEDQFDIFHVLMNEGGFCDCEILYNVFRESEYSKIYGKQKK